MGGSSQGLALALLLRANGPMTTSAREARGEGDDVLRTISDLAEADRERLDALCRQRGLSRAEGMRQALRAWLDQQPSDHQAVCGLWRDRGGTSLAWERHRSSATTPHPPASACRTSAMNTATMPRRSPTWKSKALSSGTGW